jgi:hypothetical protein
MKPTVASRDRSRVSEESAGLISATQITPPSGHIHICTALVILPAAHFARPASLFTGTFRAGSDHGAFALIRLKKKSLKLWLKGCIRHDDVGGSGRSKSNIM